MDKAAAFTATYSDFRLIKGRKVVQIVLEVPLEAADAAYTVLGGMPNPAAEIWCAVARLVQPAKEEREGAETLDDSTSTQPASGDVPARAPKNKLAQLAGMLSKEPLFHRYLETVHDLPPVNEHTATFFIRRKCNVESRSQILVDTTAGERFLKLYDDFMRWRDSDTFLEPAQEDAPSHSAF
jgi:hypothetical protein